MKTSLSVLFTIVFALNQFNAFSQDACKVLKPEISGKYTGDCKNGVADGKGVAEGKDKYEGKFKKGLPNGQGIYTWSTGEVYKGSWHEGKKQGDGKLTFKSNGIDSTTIGIWKDDVFDRKRVENPYSVYRSNGIKRYNVERFSDGDKVTLTIMKNGNNNSTVRGLTFFCTSGMTYSVGSKLGYESVIFPCNVKIIYSTSNALNTASIECAFEIEIKTPGIWDIQLDN
ncbi:MAG: hypothetical protein NTY07_16520 [Bacteroidia bacterium]|nr:hypothetical protein [Bacteroidia bacterium]